MKVSVLGCGITGAVLSRELCDRGHEVSCLEAAPRPGGLCSSEVVDGFVCDRAGGHIIFSRDEEVLRYVLDAVSPPGHHTSNRNTWIHDHGRLIQYPYENGLGDLPEQVRFECLRDYVEAAFERRQGAPRPDNFRDWCTWRFGEAMSREFMHPYNEKIWNVPLEELGVEWVAGRVPDAPLADVLRSALGIRTEGYRHQAVFHYPLEGGFETIVRGVLRHVPGGVVRTSTPCTSLRRLGDGWNVNGERHDAVISTIPLPELARVLEDVPADVASCFEALDYVSLTTVFFALDRAEVPDHSWLYFPRPEQGPQNRITYLSNYSPGNAPPGCSSIMAEVTWWRTPPGDDEDIARQVQTGLEGCGLLRSEEVRFTRCFSNRYAYILYRKDLERHLARVREWCASIGLHLAGRFGNYDYFNSDSCIRSALDLARAL